MSEHNLPTLPFNQMTKFLTTPLDSSNYLVWRNQITAILFTSDLLGYVDGTIAPPEETSASPSTDYAKWKKLDQLVYCFLNGSLSSSTARLALGHTTARSLWVGLEDHFKLQFASQQSILRRQLHTVKKGSRTIIDYLNVISTIAEELAVIGDSISDADLVLITLNGLPANFESFIRTIKNRPTSITFAELKAKLLRHEQRLLSFQEPQPLDSALAAFSTTNHSFHGRGTGRGHHSSNHFSGSPNAFGLNSGPVKITSPPFVQSSKGPMQFPEAHQSQPFRTQAPHNFSYPKQAHTSIQCQICWKQGHIASTCRFRYSESQNRFTGFHQPINNITTAVSTMNIQPDYNPASFTSNNDSKWLPKTDVTANVTPHSRIVEFVTSHDESNQVVVDNGHALPGSSTAATMATPREHIEHLRKTRFSIGGDVNPLASMLDQAVKYLSTELYTKDVHFLMELIQNAEDNEYPDGVDPSLEFVLTSRDITATGAPATLLLFNNEKGFSAKNVDSICNVGNSTKKGQRKSGYIGEKGIGFKSVFLITAQPYIFSNGYQIRFSEEPCPHCNLGYIVPEWIDDNPSLLDIKKIYGSSRTIPNTTIIFPLKPDKVKPVTQQLSSIHPEILLFLGKIKSLSIREDHENPNRNSLAAIAITKGTNFVTRKNIDAQSYTLHLSADENNDHIERECSYYMWKQRFPVKQENKVERRMEVEDWVITLAFPNGDRLHRGMSSPGVYAFLPTEMITNFPFIIQADFILVSSRETIRFDSIWNQGILDCVPSAFVNALISLVKTTEDAPVSTLPQMFNFLPVKSSPYPQLNALRKSIKTKLDEENIIPIESYMEQKFFCKPREVRRIMPAFWSVLHQAREQGVSLHNISSHGCYILNSSFDKAEYDEILDFLGVERVNIEWYASCIEGFNLVAGVKEQMLRIIVNERNK